MTDNRDGPSGNVTDLLREEIIVRWDELQREGERLHRQRGGAARPPHGESVFETDQVRWDAIELLMWLSLVPTGWVHVSRTSNPQIKREGGVVFGQLRVTLEAADGPTIEATEYILFHIVLTWRLESSGWILTGVDPDQSPEERARRGAASLYQTDPFLATIRSHLGASQDPSGTTVLAEVRDSRPTTEPAILAVLMDQPEEP